MVDVAKRPPTRAEILRKDAVVQVPMALAGLVRGVTPEGEPLNPAQVAKLALAECERLAAENASLRTDIAAARRDLRQLGDAASAITSIALCVVRRLLDLGEATSPGEITIPKKLHDRMLGASIRFGKKPDGSITARLRDEGKERVVPDA